MTYDAIKTLTILQLGEDTEDMADYLVFLETYLGNGYYELMKVRKSGVIAGVDPLSATNNELPDYIHSALADYATYAILTNGNTNKQNRAQAYYARFEKARIGLKSEEEEALDQENADAGLQPHFVNLYE
jgi:hypothetical protein